jgi:hypothetical protein
VPPAGACAAAGDRLVRLRSGSDVADTVRSCLKEFP